MKTRRMMAALVVALLSVTAVMAKDIRTAVFKVSQMHCENCCLLYTSPSPRDRG